MTGHIIKGACVLGLISNLMCGCGGGFLLTESIATMESNPVRATFQIPNETKHPVEPLPREAIIGKWRGTMMSEGAIFRGKFRSKTFTSSKELEYDFRENGNYTACATVRGKNGGDGLKTLMSGTWIYSNGYLTLNETRVSQSKDQSYNNLEKAYRVEWYSNDEIRICWKTSDAGSEFYTKLLQIATSSLTKRATIEIDKREHVILRYFYEYADGRGFVQMVVSSPEDYKRVSSRSITWETKPTNATIRQSPTIDKTVAYKIISCEKEASSAFAYRFVLELKNEEDSSLEIFGKIQQEFRTAIKKDYVESFPMTKEDSLFVEFPEYKLNNGKIEGRAVVLTISVTSLTYDPSTRNGKLAVKVNANQYEEARKWIRKNIETLARDKNIALTTDEIPPAAKFYLGREELKGGNVLEIEFKTE